MLDKTLYILNPHRDDFIWEPLYFRLIKRRPLKKYNYINELFENGNQIKLLVNDICSGIIPQKTISALPKFIRRKLISLELKKWKNINKIKGDIEIEWLDENLKTNANDNLFLFQLSNLKYLDELNSVLKKFNTVYVHLSHYYLNTPTLTKSLQKIQNLTLCGDTDIIDHPFFKKYFNWYDKNIILTPFYISDRFKKNIEFEHKENKIISTGTFHCIEESPECDYIINDWKNNSFHINRRNIYDKEMEFFNEIKCYNSPWQKGEKNWLKKILKAQKIAQKKYFNFNIVDEYNKYKLAIVGEEIGGFPGIGSFEAMACGCVALINPNTTKGIIDNENCFLPFENDWDKIKNINYSDSDLKNISDHAIEFVNNNLRYDICVNKFKDNFLN